MINDYIYILDELSKIFLLSPKLIKLPYNTENRHCTYTLKSFECIRRTEIENIFFLLLDLEMKKKNEK